jgi:hypothetical protein
MKIKEVKILYYIPESREELESIAGGVVGVMISSISPAEPMVYSGLKNGEYEFLVQGRQSMQDEDSYPINKIFAWRSNKELVELADNGIKLKPSDSHIDIYSEMRNGFSERKKLLADKGMWMEIK